VILIGSVIVCRECDLHKVSTTGDGTRKQGDVEMSNFSYVEMSNFSYVEMSNFSDVEVSNVINNKTMSNFSDVEVSNVINNKTMSNFPISLRDGLPYLSP